MSLMNITNTKKIVGITNGGDLGEGKYRIDTQYVRSVANAGALPVMLTPTDKKEDIERILDACDGILLSGGPDVDPSLYGEEKIDACGAVSEERDGFELALARAALRSGTPILAICRGIQVLNVAAGGSLWQDIPSQIENCDRHSSSGDDYKAEHMVTLTDDKIAELVGFGAEEFLVNSYHHQALKRVADGFAVMARSVKDGIVEGIYDPRARYVVGVQWHPERLAEKDANASCLFDSFVKAL